MNTSGQPDGEAPADRMSLLRGLAMLMRRYEEEQTFQAFLVKFADEHAGSGSYQLGVEFDELVLDVLVNGRATVVDDSIEFTIDFGTGPKPDVVTGRVFEQALGPIPPDYFDRPIRSRPATDPNYGGAGVEADPGEPLGDTSSE